jgi:hypothetical protein
MPSDYATVDDLEARWRPLSEAERARAAVLLGDASRHVRRRVPTLDDRLTAGSLDPFDVVAVVAGMVKRVLLAGDVEGITQASQTAGPFGEARTFANPMGNLYMTADDVAALSPVGAARTRSVRLQAYG